MNKPVYLGLSKPDLIRTVMFGFQNAYLKPKYSENVKLYRYIQLHSLPSATLLFCGRLMKYH